MCRKYIFLPYAWLLVAVAVQADETARPIPKNISAAARAYYENLPPRRGGTVDVENENALAFTREFLGMIFLANAEDPGVAYELEPAAIDGVESYWIRGAERSSGPARKSAVSLQLICVRYQRHTSARQPARSARRPAAFYDPRPASARLTAGPSNNIHNAQVALFNKRLIYRQHFRAAWPAGKT